MNVPLFEKSPDKFNAPEVDVKTPALIVRPPNDAVLVPKLNIPFPDLVKFWPPVIPAPSRVISPIVLILLALPSVIAPL